MKLLKIKTADAKKSKKSDSADEIVAIIEKANRLMDDAFDWVKKPTDYSNAEVSRIKKAAEAVRVRAEDIAKEMR